MEFCGEIAVAFEGDVAHMLSAVGGAFLQESALNIKPEPDTSMTSCRAGHFEASQDTAVAVFIMCIETKR